VITAKERRQIIEEHERKKMARLGRKSSPAKRAAVLRNLQKANEARAAKKRTRQQTQA